VSRDDAAYVADMLEACERIVSYTLGSNTESLSTDRKTLDAVLRNLQVLGEAAKRVPDPLRALAPTIAWREIAGMRDVVVHDYFGIDLAIVCNAALVLVPSLRAALQDLLGRVTGSP
jgi:uncharacterized protein with HEPN domain